MEERAIAPLPDNWILDIGNCKLFETDAPGVLVPTMETLHSE